MTRVNILLASFALIAAFCVPSKAFAGDDDFLIGKWYTSKKVNEEKIEFWVSNGDARVFHIYLTGRQQGTQNGLCYYIGYFSLSSNTVTFDSRESNYAAGAPLAFKATVNTAKTEITVISPYDGKTAFVFKKEGGLDLSDVQVKERNTVENRIRQKTSAIQTPKEAAKPVTNPSGPRQVK